MIKVKVTKNIIRKTKSTIGLTPKQMIIAGIAAAIGIVMYLTMQTLMNIEVLFMLIFAVVGSIIMFGCVNIQGQSLFEYCMKIFKGVDVRPYDSRGVFSHDEKN